MNKNKTRGLPTPGLPWVIKLSIALSSAWVVSAQADIVPVGLGSIADRANPEGYTCSVDYGTWIHNAGVVEPAIAGCDEQLGPIGTPTPVYPQLTGPAAQKNTVTHRWWGSVSFLGEMPINDTSKAGYITPDPITARISDRGFRMLGIPGGLKMEQGNSYIYAVPDPFSEVFDGLAIANTQHTAMDAYLYDYSDGSMTVEWQSQGDAVMRATFVHGSPYAYLDIFSGELLLKSKAPNGPEKGVYHQQNNTLGIWTDVAGNRNTYLVVGDGPTEFNNVESQGIRVANTTGRMTLAVLPVDEALPDAAMIDHFAAYAINRIDEVRIESQVDSQTNEVQVRHRYLNQGSPVTTLAGLMPLHWKNTSEPVTTDYKIRSARGVVKFTPLSEFSYQLPFIGVLPTLPANDGSYDQAKLAQLIRDFINAGEDSWNDKTDTYWAGKNYGKVAELAALAHSHGMTEEREVLVDWLKAELEDWFTAETGGQPDKTRYFSYDSEWNTLLGYDESFGSQQQLNDHHFHYGYFVRAAAEICRTDKSWCADDAWGGMIELLIRDYAAQRNDPLFPYVRNFDPANGFSWASGHANFALGNNNESTSEAANAYGAIVLYGMITGDAALTRHGMYLHASSTATYWEYWNNIDRYRGLTGDADNFPAVYDKMTTSIIWGNGMVFSTWFSPAYAHILGIQGLPLNPLVMHIGQHADYLADYVELGMTESGNGKPSGLPVDQWRDVWWNIWSMTNPQAAIEDFNTMDFNYDIEAGETMAHTYHWIHSFNQFGQLESGTGDITADSPAALVFNKNGYLTYLAYNFSDTSRLVSFSDGMAIAIPPNSFGMKHSGDIPDTLEPDLSAPTEPGPIQPVELTATSATLVWAASTDNVGVTGYVVTVESNPRQIITTAEPRMSVSGLLPDSQYPVSVVARDGAGNESAARTGSFTTREQSPTDLPPSMPGNLRTDEITVDSGLLSWDASQDDVGVSDYRVEVSQGGVPVTSVTTVGTQRWVDSLQADTLYSVTVTARDTIGQVSDPAQLSFRTESPAETCVDFCLKEQGDALVVTVKTGDIVDLHYTVNNGAQQNVRMARVGTEHYYQINNLGNGDRIDYFFTVIGATAYDTAWSQHVFGESGNEPDTEAPTQPGAPVSTNLTHQAVTLTWTEATDNIGVDHYEITLEGVGNYIAMTNSIRIDGLSALSNYRASVVAVDAADNVSSAAIGHFTTKEVPEVPDCTDLCARELDGDTLLVTIEAGGIADLHYIVNNGGQLNVRMQVDGDHHEYRINGLASGDTIRYFVTVIDGPAYDTDWQEHSFTP